MRSGFSLVELSIVLVILGLLTGGILTGQSLIRASELRAVTTEYQRYVAASQTFRDKYFAIPGDFRDATRFWGRMTNTADCITNSSAAVATPGACDGTGNGTVLEGAAASQSSESVQFWRHLALAGLIEGSYTGLTGSGGADHYVGGTNTPRSKLTNAIWATRGNSAYFVGDPNAFAGDYGNQLIVGGSSPSSWNYGPVFKPEEAWNIDTKMDDGKPGQGKVYGYYWNNLCATGAASQTDNANGVYNLSSSAGMCALYFLRSY